MVFWGPNSIGSVYGPSGKGLGWTQISCRQTEGRSGCLEPRQSAGLGFRVRDEGLQGLGIRVEFKLPNSQNVSRTYLDKAEVQIARRMAYADYHSGSKQP